MTALLIALSIGWIVLLVWLWRRYRVLPLIGWVFIYWWSIAVAPVLSYIGLLRAGHRRERVVRFLKLADDLRMRRQRIDHPLALGSGSDRGPGEGGIAG